MKLLIAGLATETNSFSPIPTGAISFEETFVSRKATDLPANLFSAPLHEWRKLAEARGWEVTESLCAFAQPAGLTVRTVYEVFRDEILGDIRAAMPEILLLSMHGAMIADGYDDCEGDLLARARDILGDGAVIGLEIDPHSHLTEQMLDCADLIVCYKEYPHTDSPDRARELFEMAADTAAGRIRPVMAEHDCRMIAMYHTTKAPMRGFVDDMMAREGRDAILSLSLVHGFPWGDSPRVGTRMLAITDADAGQAKAVAQEFGQRLFDMRDDLRMDWPDISAALDIVEAASEFPLVLADFADNAGGGAPSDATFVLQQVVARGMSDIAMGIFWDPILVRMCREVGIGARLDVRLGGKIGVMSGDPVDLNVTVRGIGQDMSQQMGETKMGMGNAVWLETAGGVHLVVNDLRTQCFHPNAFSDLGIPLDRMKAIVVKSSQHFQAGFAPIAAQVVQIATPGAIPPDFTIIPYTKRDDNYWPKTETPFK
ncbi:MAG: M81 family metallopeptidase [Rhodobacteraceae bacterium]|nr:M81 family metallopeptidase [Paracoccaceae bacterium]